MSFETDISDVYMPEYIEQQSKASSTPFIVLKMDTSTSFQHHVQKFVFYWTKRLSPCKHNSIALPVGLHKVKLILLTMYSITAILEAQRSFNYIKISINTKYF